MIAHLAGQRPTTIFKQSGFNTGMSCSHRHGRRAPAEGSGGHLQEHGAVVALPGGALGRVGASSGLVRQLAVAVAPADTPRHL